MLKKIFILLFFVVGSMFATTEKYLEFRLNRNNPNVPVFRTVSDVAKEFACNGMAWFGPNPSVAVKSSRVLEVKDYTRLPEDTPVLVKVSAIQACEQRRGRQIDISAAIKVNGVNVKHAVATARAEVASSTLSKKFESKGIEKFNESLVASPRFPSLSFNKVVVDVSKLDNTKGILTLFWGLVGGIVCLALVFIARNAKPYLINRDLKMKSSKTLAPVISIDQSVQRQEEEQNIAIPRNSEELPVNGNSFRRGLSLIKSTTKPAFLDKKNGAALTDDEEKEIIARFEEVRSVIEHRFKIFGNPAYMRFRVIISPTPRLAMTCVHKPGEKGHYVTYHLAELAKHHSWKVEDPVEIRNDDNHLERRLMWLIQVADTVTQIQHPATGVVKP